MNRDLTVALDAPFSADFIKPFVKPASKEQWSADVRSRSRSIWRAAANRMVLGALGRGMTRTEDYVNSYYARWNKFGLAEIDPMNDGTHRPVTWRDQRLMVTPWAVTRISLLRLCRLIEFLQPRRVLEVGTGNGQYPLLLSCVFPEVEFHGVELTDEGVAVARKFQDLERLPGPYIDFIPVEVRDPAGFKRAQIVQGSARALQYEDRSFDLVFTCLALEQMEQLRHQAFSEITRVSRSTVSHLEPFSDVNRKGLCRAYVYSMNYFQGRVDDLRSYGFVPEARSTDFPQAFYMNILHAVARRERP